MADKQVLARFFTRLPPELRVPASEVAVPATLKRYGLSQIINHLLALDPPRPFDFLIDGELVRRSLEQHLLQRGASLEAAVEIEYVPAVPPPRERGAPPQPQDDWVACVCALSGGVGGRLATGCYDGVVRLWDAGAGLEEDEDDEGGGGAGAAPAVEAAGAFLAHRGGVTAAAAAAAAAAGGAAQQLLVTAGKDHKARLWRLGGAGGAGGGRKKSGGQQQQQHQCLAELAGHADAVEALALLGGGGGGGAGGAGGRCATGGWDGALLVWRGARELERAAADAPSGAATPDRKGGAGAAAAKKKRRVATDADAGEGEDRAPASAAPLITESPLARLQVGTAAAGGGAGGHCVSALAWPSRSCLYSGGYDHSVRLWDAERGGGESGAVAVAACPTARPVLALAAPAPLVGGGLGEDDEGGEQQQQGHLVAFGSADGVLRLWDARAGPRVALAADAGDSAAAAAAAAAGEDGGPSAAARAVGAAGGGGSGAWVSAVAWRPGSLHHVATASHDGSVRMFDLRTPVPLGTLAGLHSGGGKEREGGKALCIAWWSGGGQGAVGVPRFLASGGTDCRMRVSGLPAGCGDGIL